VKDRETSKSITTLLRQFDKRIKGVWGMPWILKAKKDVLSCDKLRGDAQDCKSVDFRMGQPNSLKNYYHA
jgi:hypothetical protein